MSSATRPVAAPTYGLVGRSQAMVELREQITRLQGRHEDVLIVGESGVGKELTARAIAKVEKEKDWIVRNCATFDVAADAESELFGHGEKVFTGVGKRIGIFVAANRKTLFLDEIGTLERGTQAQLLRVLQERRVLVRGEVEEKEVEFRGIFGTNENLRECVNAGTFREDLYYRLVQLVVKVPALRDRTDDIEDLVRHFVGDERAKRFAGSAWKQLMVCDWRGNVRELRNTVKRLVVEVCGTIGARHVSEDREQFAIKPEAGQGGTDSGPKSGLDWVRRHRGQPAPGESVVVGEPPGDCEVLFDELRRACGAGETTFRGVTKWFELELIAKEDGTNGEVAEKLNISERTVQRLRAEIRTRRREGTWGRW